MRRLLLSSALLLSACASNPPPAPVPAAQPVVVARPRVSTSLLGLTAAELAQRFGTPALQVREGAGLKLQFRGRNCVLDAYLYAGMTGGVERVAHVDARLPSGTDTDPVGCIGALSAP